MEQLSSSVIVMAAMFGIIGIAVRAVRWTRKSSRRAAFLRQGGVAD